MKYPDIGDLIKMSVFPLGTPSDQLYVVRNWTIEEFPEIAYHVEPFGEGACCQGYPMSLPQYWFDLGWVTVVSTEVEETGENKETESLVGRTIKSTHPSQTFLPLGDYVIEGEEPKEDFTGTYSIYFIRPKEGGEDYVASSRWLGSGLIEIVEEKEDLVGRVFLVKSEGNTGLGGDFYVIEAWHEEDVWEVREVGGLEVSYWVSEEWLENGWVELLEGDED